MKGENKLIVLQFLGFILGICGFGLLMTFVHYKVHKISTEKNSDKLREDLLNF